jgi:general secretion pathway protein A
MTPDPDYLFFTEKHREAYAHLVYGIRERGGFIEITGEVGAGKTTLCRALMNEFDDGTRIALILNPMLSDVELLRAINDEFFIRCEGESKKDLLDALNKYLIDQHRAGRNVVILIDEAQNLSEETLEQIRIISNLETVKAKLVQIVLVGQPELREKMAKKELRQLDQRITVRYHLGAMDRKETEQYIAHRLKVAGGSGKVKFTAKALKVVYEFSSGIPRKVNTVCDHSLLQGYVSETSTIDNSVVERAVEEITGSRKRKSTGRRLLPRRAVALGGTLAAGLLLAAGSLYLVKHDIIPVPDIESWSAGLFASTDSPDLHAGDPAPKESQEPAVPDIEPDPDEPADQVPGPEIAPEETVAVAGVEEPAGVLKPPVQTTIESPAIHVERSLPTPAAASSPGVGGATGEPQKEEPRKVEPPKETSPGEEPSGESVAAATETAPTPGDEPAGALWEAMMGEPDGSEASPGEAEESTDETAAVATAGGDEGAETGTDTPPGTEADAVDDGETEAADQSTPDPSDVAEVAAEPEGIDIDEQKVIRPQSPDERIPAVIFSLVHRWIPDEDLVRAAYKAVVERGMPVDEALFRLDLTLHELLNMEFAALRLFNLPAAVEYHRAGEDAPQMALVVRVNDEFLVLSDPIKGGFISTATEFPHRWTGRAWLVAPADQVTRGTLDRDSRGVEVAYLERRLARLGYLDQIADKEFDRRTARAVKEFQEDYSLERTGEADVHTQLLLFSMTSEFVLPTLELKVAESES